jgi:hypothetical protein
LAINMGYEDRDGDSEGTSVGGKGRFENGFLYTIGNKWSGD